MKTVRHFIALWALAALAALIGSTALAQTPDEDDGYNEVTIRPSDIPADAPSFDRYRVPVYSGKHALPDLKSHPLSRMFRTRLAEAAKEPVDFAGHFVLAGWGCGSSCACFAIIDVHTGRVFHPKGFTVVDATNVHTDLKPLNYRKDSSLLVLIGSPEERTQDRGIYYLRWKDDHFETVRFIKRPWYSDSPLATQP